MTEGNNITRLLDKLQAGSISAEEADQLRELVMQRSPGDRELLEKLLAKGFSPSAWSDDKEIASQLLEALEADAEHAEAALAKSLQLRASKDKRARQVVIFRRALVAASIGFLAMAGYVIFERLFNQFPDVLTQQPPTGKMDNSGAVLYYGDQVYQLDSGHAQPITHNGTTILRQGNEVTYQNSNNARPLASKIITAPGKQYRVVLPDGTVVWLNGNSTLEFSSAFTGSTREVVLLGEGLFEVTHNPARPFIVHSRKMAVTVTGTRFNIDSYDETSIHTTLLEGGVLISKSSLQKKLSPGQMARVNLTDNSDISIGPADTLSVIEWKQGVLSFDGERIARIMQRISEIYGISYKITGDQNRRYSGQFSLGGSAKELCKQLELNKDIEFNWKSDREVDVVLQ